MDLIKNKHKFSSLINPLAFFREGVNDFKTFRYINSFFNFYFVLEGLYGNGKTKNKDVAREFADSIEFNNIIISEIERLKQEPEHWTKLNEMCRVRSKKINAKGIIHLLVLTRG